MKKRYDYRIHMPDGENDIEIEYNRCSSRNYDEMIHICLQYLSISEDYVQEICLKLFCGISGSSENNKGFSNVGGVANAFLKWYANAHIMKLQKRWKEAEWIDQRRIPILLQALEVHRRGDYYDSTASLMCQIDGVITDMYKYVKSLSLDVKRTRSEKKCYMN